jgi:hypothetical protein
LYRLTITMQMKSGVVQNCSRLCLNICLLGIMLVVLKTLMIADMLGKKQ